MDLDLEFVFVYVSTYTFVALYGATLLLRLSSDIGRQQEVYYFRLLLTALIVYCVSESLWAVGNFGYSATINRFNIPLTVINATMVNSVCYLWFCYQESYLLSPVVDKKQLHFLVSIPHIIALILIFSSFFTDWVFYLAPSGETERGPLYIATVGVAFGYAFVSTARAFIGALRATDKQRKRELFILSLFVIPPVVVGIVDTIFPLMPIVAPAFFFSLLIVFTMLQETQISTDSLTGLNNRRRAERHLETMVADAREDDPALFFLIDGNSFKNVNDTYGHLEGDRALTTIAEALRNACLHTNAFIARWGGDEFVVMAQTSEVGTPQEFADKVKACLLQEAQRRNLPYELTVSVGHSHCTGAENAQQVVAAADESLYEAKSKLPGRSA